MSEKGVFALDRGIWDHPVLVEKDREFSRREAWAWLISEAAWRPQRIRIAGMVVNLKRGQLAHSIRYMAEKWGWSKSRVARFLDDLKSETMIGTETGTGITVTTICKYDEYQRVSLPDRDSNEPTSGTAAGQQRDKEESIKNIKDTTLRVARTREDLDRLEASLRDAACLQEDPNPKLCDLSPILGLLDAGYSLEETILPSIRAHARDPTRRVRSWAFFVPGIQESASRRANSASVPVIGVGVHRNGRENSISAAHSRVAAALGLENVEASRPNRPGEVRIGPGGDDVRLLSPGRSVQS